jgi:hypothetical protein
VEEGELWDASRSVLRLASELIRSRYTDPMVDGILGQASLPGCGSSVCGGKTTAYTR